MDPTQPPMDPRLMAQLLMQGQQQQQPMFTGLPQDQFSAAAERTRNSVMPPGGRQQGGLTYGPEALAAAPMVWGNIISDLAGKARNQFGQ